MGDPGQQVRGNDKNIIFSHNRALCSGSIDPDGGSADIWFLTEVKMRDADEIIKGMDEIIKPFVAEHIAKIDYEGMGQADAEDFSKEFDYILMLARKGAEPEHEKELFFDEEINAFKLRDTKYDIIIQCDSEEDHERAIRILESIGGERISIEP